MLKIFLIQNNYNKKELVFISLGTLLLGMFRMNYKQISCDLYDRIESLSVFKKIVEIVYWSESDKHEKVKGFISDVFTKEKAEFLTINDLSIRLDKIATISEV